MLNPHAHYPWHQLVQDGVLRFCEMPMIKQGHLYIKTYMESFVYLFQRMHGMQYLYNTFACTQVAAEKGADKLKSEDDVNEG